MIDKTDEQIFDDLESGDAAYELTGSPAWNLINEAMKRLEKKASEALLNVDPKSESEIMQLQQIIKMYRKDFIPGMLESWKAIGEFAFNQAKDRGLLGK